MAASAALRAPQLDSFHRSALCSHFVLAWVNGAEKGNFLSRSFRGIEVVTGISPWQRVFLVAGSALCLSYAATRYVHSEGFFLQAVIGFVCALAAMAPPHPGGRQWPIRPTITKLHKRIALAAVLAAAVGKAGSIAWHAYQERQRIERNVQDQAIWAEKRRKAQVVVHCPSSAPRLPDWGAYQDQFAHTQKRLDPAQGGDPIFGGMIREREEELLSSMKNAATPREVAIAIRTIRGMGKLGPIDDREVQERTWTLCQNGYRHLLEGAPL